MSTTSKASQRILSLLDENSFAPIGELVTARATDLNADPRLLPGDGCITGYGTIENDPVYVYSQDASVLGGTIGEMHARKIVNLYNLALKTGTPVIGIIDCGGMRLQEGTDAMYALGRIYAKQAQASGVIPQITVICGSCGGGLALFAGMTDFTFMDGEAGRLFVNAPNALDGNRADKNDTSRAAFQAENAGTVDVVADEADIFAKVRALVTMLPQDNDDFKYTEEITDDLNRICEDIASCAGDTSIALSMIADDQDFFETGALYAPEMVTGFLRLNGCTVGAVANRSEIYDAEGKAKKLGTRLTANGCRKAADFVKFCDAFDIPVLSLTNVTGYEATLASEKEIAVAAAKLIAAFAGASVPKVNVIVGEAMGSAVNVMNSNAIGADFTIAWNGARFGVMDGKLAAEILCDGADADTLSAKGAEIDAMNNNALSAARRGYVDQIIDPSETRKYVVAAFEMLFSKAEPQSIKKHMTV